MHSEMPDSRSPEQVRRSTEATDPMTLTDRLRWFVVQSKPREEERARHFLQEKGFEVYLPLMEVAVTRGRQAVIKEKPLFPSYLFCRFNQRKGLAHVRWTKGVAKILPESARPISIPSGMVTSIRNLEHGDGVIRKKPLHKDDLIRITRGPMKDILGIFDHWTSDQGRIRVLLNFINYQASVELHHSLVERVA